MNANTLNYVLIALYVVNIGIQGAYGNWWQSLYWVGATILTIGVVGGLR